MTNWKALSGHSQSARKPEPDQVPEGPPPRLRRSVIPARICGHGNSSPWTVFSHRKNSMKLCGHTTGNRSSWL